MGEMGVEPDNELKAQVRRDSWEMMIFECVMCILFLFTGGTVFKESSREQLINFSTL